MRTVKTVEITGKEILEYFVSLSEDCTISEAQDIIKKSEIFYDIKEDGDHDRGTYSRTLRKIKITFDK